MINGFRVTRAELVRDGPKDRCQPCIHVVSWRGFACVVLFVNRCFSVLLVLFVNSENKARAREASKLTEKLRICFCEKGLLSLVFCGASKTAALKQNVGSKTADRKEARNTAA